MLKFYVIFLFLLATTPAYCQVTKADFFVATNGRDDWSGKLAEPNQTATDGPFATIRRAKMAVRILRSQHYAPPEGITVLVRSGVYYLNEPIVFTKEDTAPPSSPTIYAAFPGERPVISGGALLKGWRKGRQGWEVSLAQTLKEKGTFQQLFVNGERRARPRLPQNGFYYVAKQAVSSKNAPKGAFDRFAFEANDIRSDFANRQDIDVLVFQSYTVASLKIAEVNRESKSVLFTGPTRISPSAAFKRGTRYLLENVREALQNPREWYLDTTTRILTYLPQADEDMASAVVIAPRLERLVEVQGTLTEKAFVSNIVFRGLIFAHTRWTTPASGVNYSQGAVETDGAIQLKGARNWLFDHCTLTQVANYGINFIHGCQSNRVVNCDFIDLGAGGIKIGLPYLPKTEAEVVSDNTVENCLISGGGRVHPAAVGILVAMSSGNVISHNEITDYYYSGISIGWFSEFKFIGAKNNRIDYNRVSLIGQGLLSDLGGIYTLGQSPGTIISHNIIHDISTYDDQSGGWGVYLDNASSNIRVENNLVYNTEGGSLHLHYARDNIINNNIFALSKSAQIQRSTPEKHHMMDFTRNIVVWKDADLFRGDWKNDQYKFNNNIYYDLSGKSVSFDGKSFSEWKRSGQDANSIVGDPLFSNVAQNDYRMQKESISQKIRFQPIEIDTVGRSGVTTNTSPALPRAFPPKVNVPTRLLSIIEDFEYDAIGAPPLEIRSREEGDLATVRVINSDASSGKQSLKLFYSKKRAKSYYPLLPFQLPNYNNRISIAFSIRPTPISTLLLEGRESENNLTKIGPSIRIDSNNLFAQNRFLLSLPNGQWIRIELCWHHDTMDNTYDVTVRVHGKAAQVFRDLPSVANAVKMSWLGIGATKNSSGDCIIDDIVIQPDCK
jgi:parallel beta-helix repeat protein